MITYLTIQFDSEGRKPSDIVSALEDIGFRPATGFYDLQYDWKGDADVDDVVRLGHVGLPHAGLAEHVPGAGLHPRP